MMGCIFCHTGTEKCLVCSQCAQKIINSDVDAIRDIMKRAKKKGQADVIEYLSKYAEGMLRDKKTKVKVNQFSKNRKWAFKNGEGTPI